MSAKKGVLKGVKISNNHSTIIDDCVPVIELVKSMPEVTKVVIGAISRVGAGKRRIKTFSVPAGLKVTVRGANMQQTLFIYTSSPEKVEKELDALWTKQLR